MAVLVWSCVPGVSGVPCVEQFNCGGVEKGDCDEVGVSTGGGGRGSWLEDSEMHE